MGTWSPAAGPGPFAACGSPVGATRPSSPVHPACGGSVSDRPGAERRRVGAALGDRHVQVGREAPGGPASQQMQKGNLCRGCCVRARVMCTHVGTSVCVHITRAVPCMCAVHTRYTCTHTWVHLCTHVPRVMHVCRLGTVCACACCVYAHMCMCVVCTCVSCVRVHISCVHVHAGLCVDVRVYMCACAFISCMSCARVVCVCTCIMCTCVCPCMRVMCAHVCRHVFQLHLQRPRRRDTPAAVSMRHAQNLVSTPVCTETRGSLRMQLQDGAGQPRDGAGTPRKRSRDTPRPSLPEGLPPRNGKV